jgi:hypothetical protein
VCPAEEGIGNIDAILLTCVCIPMHCLTDLALVLCPDADYLASMMYFLDKHSLFNTLTLPLSKVLNWSRSES